MNTNTTLLAVAKEMMRLRDKPFEVSNWAVEVAVREALNLRVDEDASAHCETLRSMLES